MKEKGLYIKLIPVMLAFFAMGLWIWWGLLPLCEGRFESDRFGGEYLSVTCILLVSDFLCSNRNADEPDRTEEDCIT